MKMAAHGDEEEQEEIYDERKGKRR